MKSIDIKLLGNFRLLVDGKDRTSKLENSPKKTLLLQYLILNKEKPVSSSTLLDLLWENDDSLNLSSSLKTLVSRLRKDLSDLGLDNVISTRPSSYLWNPSVVCHVDVFRLEELCLSLSTAKELDSITRKNFDEVLFIYDADLSGDVVSSPAISSSVLYYRNLYFKTVYNYINLLLETNDYTQIIRICKTSLEIDFLDSRLNYELMKALMKVGKNKDALSHYQHITDLYFIHLGVKPSDEILDLYKQLIFTFKDSESTVEKIYDELIHLPDNHGAYVCDYSIFKDIYQLYTRSLKRQDIPIFLSVISIQQIGNEKIDALEMDRTMRTLQYLIQSNLRNCDTITRYSINQYALFLPNIPNYEAAKVVLHRIQKLFYSDINNAKYKFSFHLLKLENQI